MTSTAGRLLLAEPMLGDPNFHRSVVLMIEHSQDGALGLVLNRPTDLTVGVALPAWRHLASVPAVLHVGGPVEDQSGWCLARLSDAMDQPGFVPVLGDMGLLDLELDPTDLTSTVLAARVYAGYSGWGPGQLDDELAEDAWIVVDGAPDDPFLPDADALWERILQRQGGHLARLSLFPARPQPELTAGGPPPTVLEMGSGQPLWRLAMGMTAALAVVAGACSGGGDGAAAVTDGSTSSTTAAGSAAADGPGVTNATAPRRGGATAGTGGSTAGEGSGGSSPSTTAAPAVIEVGSLALGRVAPALLRPGRGDRVVLEVRAQAGAEPSGATIDHLVSVLRSASGKQVAVDGIDGIGGSAQAWTRQGIIAAAAAAADTESGRTQVVLRLLFLRGTYEGDQGILGIAVAGDVAAVFSDRIASAAGLLVSPSIVEDAVSMHELGHLLALVDLVVGSGRGDSDHPGHSRNRRSVMYWQVESDLITQLIDGGIPRDYDDADRAELAQIRAG